MCYNASMKIEILNNDEVKITPETNYDVAFWENIKKQLREKDAFIKSLKKENKILRQEISFLKKGK